MAETTSSVTPPTETLSTPCTFQQLLTFVKDAERFYASTESQVSSTVTSTSSTIVLT